MTSATITLPFVPSLLVYSDDGARLVVGGSGVSFVDFGSPGFAVVDTGTGRVTWQLDGWNCPAAAIAGSRVAVCQFRGTGVSSEFGVALYDLESGHQVWRRDDIFGAGVSADPGGGRLVINTGHGYALLALETGADVARLALEPVPRFRPVISPAGRQFAVADTSRLTIADLATGAIRHEIPTSAMPLAVAYDDAGRTLTSVGLDAFVTVVDTVSGEPISHVPLEDADLAAAGTIFGRLAVHLVALSPDRQIVVVAGTGLPGTTGITGMYSARTGARIGAVPGVTQLAPRTEFSPDARHVAVTSILKGDQVVAAPRPRAVWEQQTRATAAATFDRTGRLATAYKTETQAVVQLVAVSSDPVLKIAVRAARGTPEVRNVDVTGVGRGQVLSASSDQAARLHSADGGELLYERLHPGPLADIAFLQAGQSFVTACADGGVRLFNTATGEQRWIVRHSGPVNGLACRPEGDLVCSGGRDKTVRCIDAATGTERWRMSLPSAVLRLVAGPDVGFVVVACADRTARALAVSDGAERWPIPVPHDGHITALAVSPDGTTVATACDDGSALVLASGTGTIIRRVSHARGVTAVACSADSRTVLSGSLDGAVLASSVSDPTAMPRTLAQAAAPVTQIVAYDRDPAAAVATEDGMVRVLDLDLGTELVRFFGDAPVYDIAVAAGLLVSGAADGTIHVRPRLDGQHVRPPGPPR